MNNKPLKVFMLEDLKTDITLIKRQCLKYNPNLTFITASNKSEFHEKMTWVQPDLMISDYALPDYTGLDALLFVKEKFSNIPFIFVSGSLNDEEKVARAVLNGADGFVIKQNLETLPVVLDEVITKTAVRLEEAKQKAEEKRQRQILLEKLEAKIIQLESESKKDEVLQIVKKLQAVS